jgi:hypothetical protein
MGKISKYPLDTVVTLDDFVVGTDAEDNDVTKNYSIGSIIALVPDTAWGDITGTLSDQADLQAELNAKQDTLVSGTNIKTINSTTLLGSGDLAVQEVLVSGTNIKTVNNVSLLGSGNISTLLSYSLLIDSASVLTQQQSIGTILQIEFGAGITRPEITLGAAGEVTFVQAGNYIINVFVNPGRETPSGGSCQLNFRTLLNGTTFGETIAFNLVNNSLPMPYEFTIPYTAIAGEEIKFETLRDSSGFDTGELLPQPSDWTIIPSASIKIWKEI